MNTSLSFKHEILELFVIFQNPEWGNLCQKSVVPSMTYKYFSHAFESHSIFIQNNVVLRLALQSLESVVMQSFQECKYITAGSIGLLYTHVYLCLYYDPPTPLCTIMCQKRTQQICIENDALLLLLPYFNVFLFLTRVYNQGYLFLCCIHTHP